MGGLMEKSWVSLLDLLENPLNDYQVLKITIHSWKCTLIFSLEVVKLHGSNTSSSGTGALVVAVVVEIIVVAVVVAGL